MDRTILGKRIREERLRCGLTQEQTAECINVSTTYIGFIERGERSVTLEKLVLLAECFHITVDYLLQDILPETPSALDQQMMQLWHSASDSEKHLLLSVMKSILASNKK